ncbi:MAG: UDP-N-acetylmuramoyl-L-alanyl-D-glutamate--2,6-diaminopimelate ligase [bacterium]
MLFDKIYPVTCHTDHVGPNSTFVVIKGFKEDGLRYIQTAIEKGATKIVLDQSHKEKILDQVQEDKNQAPGNKKIEYIFVKDTRIALAELCAQALGSPATKLKFIGITGTSGKTTTTYLIDYILRESGYKTALLGSVKNRILDQEEEITLTTQNSDYIQMFLAECVKKGVQVVIMEVSSHGLALNRIHGIKFDVAGFTNLSPEHMDFHPTMDHYFQTKTKIFDYLKKDGLAVINTDNEWGFKAANILRDNNGNQNLKTITFGQTTPNSNLEFEKFELRQNSLHDLKIKFTKCNQIIQTKKLLGEFNGYNIAMAFLACKHFNIASDKIAQAIQKFVGVPGRMQCHTLKNGAQAFVDFAHKPDAFEKVLKNLRPHTNNLIVVFGCGGNRDKTKRPVMGSSAAKYADLIIITDDNPRDEDRQIIANEIIAGIPKAKKAQTICILDRKEAIEKATSLATPNSIIAILGKGHENYYLIQGKKYHFDDFEEISRF